jgi:hypothetical protein
MIATTHATTPHRKNPAADAEWMDAKRAFITFTLGRTTLSRLAREKKIRACSLAEEHMARGKKLYCADDIRAYLAQRAEKYAAA